MKNQNRIRRQSKSPAAHKQAKPANRVTIGAFFSKPEIAAIDEGCRRLGIDRSAFIEQAIREKMERETKTRRVVLWLPEKLEAQLDVVAKWDGESFEEVCLGALNALVGGVTGDIETVSRGEPTCGLGETARQRRMSKGLASQLATIEKAVA